MKLRERAKQLKTDIPAIFLALKKKETPWYAKALAVLTIGYALSPIDLIPDFIPVLGYLDDLILLPMLAAATIRSVPKDIMERCREESQRIWKEGKPKRWYYGVPIVLVWLAAAALVIKLFFSPGPPVHQTVTLL